MGSEVCGKLAALTGFKGCLFRVQLVAFFKGQCLGQGALMGFGTQLDVGMDCTCTQFTGDTLSGGKSSNPELPWLAGGLGQQEPHEVQHSLLQSPAPGIAGCQGCTSVGKGLGPWLVTNQI